MKLNLSPLGTSKLAIHSVQGLLVFTTACIALAMDSQTGKADGRGIWFNILCYFSIPALIYLAVVPLWARSQRFANVYAFLAIDIIFAIFWLSAWASLVSWNRAGMASGAEKKKLDHSAANCTTFDPDFGNEKKCQLANTCVGFGVVIFITFIPTAIISYLYLRRTFKNPDGSSPWLGKSSAYSAPGGMEAGLTSGAGGTKDGVWSTDTADLDEDAHHNHRPDSAGTDRGGHQQEDKYRLLHGGATEADGGHHPGRRWDDERDGRGRYGGGGGGMHEEDTGYKGASGGSYQPPSALSPDGYASEFPQAPYGYNGAGHRI